MKPRAMKRGGAAKKMMRGGKADTKMMRGGGKMKMVEKNGKKVPAFAADGVGKMKRGGATKKMMRGGMAGKPMIDEARRNGEEEVMSKAASQKSLDKWTKQKWRTKSGKPSTQGPKATGERYLPEKAIKALSPSEYAATTKAKREGTRKGKQFVKQPKGVAKKTAQIRKGG
jgi:hypothetical protein